MTLTEICRSKKAYASKTTAEHVILAMKENGVGVHRRKQLRAYRCPNCTNWHLTSQRKK